MEPDEQTEHAAGRVSNTTFTLESRTVKLRSRGPDLEHRITAPDGVAVRGESSGRSLRSPAAFRRESGSPAWTLSGAGRLSPSTWVLRDGDGRDLARFESSSIRRGATRIDVTSGAELVFEPASNLARDYAKAALLVDSDHFVLRSSGNVVADTASAAVGADRQSVGDFLGALPQLARDAVRGRRRDFHRAGQLNVVGDFEGVSPELFGALLLFHDRVIHFMRSP